MNILVFRLTDADSTWYVLPCESPRLYSFGSDADAEHFANQLSEADGGTPVHMERSIAQTAALI